MKKLKITLLAFLAIVGAVVHAATDTMGIIPKEENDLSQKKWKCSAENGATGWTEMDIPSKKRRISAALCEGSCL